MNIQEMGTLAQYRLPGEDLHPEQRIYGHGAPVAGACCTARAIPKATAPALPDFVKLAESFHATGLRARNLGELDDVILRMLAEPGPVIADICVDKMENCFPMIPSGAAHNEMILGPEHVRPRRQHHR